ncbi:glycosyltransferase [Pseudomonadota bacterium]
MLRRNPHPSFDAQWYLKNYPDVAGAGFDPLVHFIQWGRKEGRKTRAVGAKHPTRDLSKGAVKIDRRVDHWDIEREQNFLSLIAKYRENKPELDSVFVSVILPTYNRAYEIEVAIKSVINQSHKSWELIICDDGSLDNTNEVVAPFLIDQRIRYVKEKNGGVAKARNVGLSVSTGIYVFYLDSDNSWRSNFLETMIAFLDAGKLDSAYSGAVCNNDAGKEPFYRGDDFYWKECLILNYVDMNCFGHKRELISKCSYFDESLRRLVDWDFILRLTRDSRTSFAPFCGVNYYDGEFGKRITRTEFQRTGELDSLAELIRKKNKIPRLGSGSQPSHLLCEDIMEESLSFIENNICELDIEDSMKVAPEISNYRIGYVLWDWPALSQTFVLNEIRLLIDDGADVKVYYKIFADHPATLDFEVEATKIEDETHLARLIQKDKRTILHSPFAYPATTLLTWPVSIETKIPFSFMPGGVDISHYENMKRNRVAEVASCPNCLGVITIGSYHRDFLIEQGVPSAKIVMERQAARLPKFSPRYQVATRPRVITVGRFIEKKGLKHLIHAAAQMPEIDIILYGFGPLGNELQLLVAELGLSNVCFAGPLSSKAALHDAYANADLFVLPCIQASNGDLDGLPTVLLEAGASGIPLVSTRIANIPDLVLDEVTGFLCPPEDSEALAQVIDRALSMSTKRRRRMIDLTRKHVVAYASHERTVRTLKEVWSKREIDIVLVTYDTPEYDNWKDTEAVIDRIYTFTSMPFNLYVVDNNSQAKFLKRLKDKYGAKPNFSLIELQNNLLCGPASNIGIEKGESEYIIYICSKEGFILNHGWERDLVHAMDENPDAAIGGHLVGLPKFQTAAAIKSYPDFSEWRNKVYASDYPSDKIEHVQGGFYILRRSVFQKAGGFNEQVPHNGMDVEYSYYLRSLGYKLLRIGNVYSITTKTLPRLTSLVDEHAILVHPSGHNDISQFDSVVRKSVKHCNACGWQGSEFINKKNVMPGTCPSCGISGFGRTAYRLLSYLGVLQERPNAIVIGNDSRVEKVLAQLCKDVIVESVSTKDDASKIFCKTLERNSNYKLIVIDHLNWDEETIHVAVSGMANFVRKGGMLIVGSAYDNIVLIDVMKRVFGTYELNIETVEYLSEVCEYDTYPVYWVSS